MFKLWTAFFLDAVVASKWTKQLRAVLLCGIVSLFEFCWKWRPLFIGFIGVVSYFCNYTHFTCTLHAFVANAYLSLALSNASIGRGASFCFILCIIFSSSAVKTPKWIARSFFKQLLIGASVFEKLGTKRRKTLQSLKNAQSLVKVLGGFSPLIAYIVCVVIIRSRRRKTWPGLSYVLVKMSLFLAFRWLSPLVRVTMRV